MPSQYKTQTLGFPRIGEQRELKKATEAYWAGAMTREQLQEVGKNLRQTMWQTQSQAGIDWIPTNDFSFYDRMLDWSCLLNAIPARFQNTSLHSLDVMFQMARGRLGTSGEAEAQACEMTKWFDTNYHYIVPELDLQTSFKLQKTSLFDEFKEALQQGFCARPQLIGPVTYLLKSKASAQAPLGFHPLDLLDRLLPVYAQILNRLRQEGASWVLLEEPVFSETLDEFQQKEMLRAYEYLVASVPGVSLQVAHYYGYLGKNLTCFCSLPVQGLHLDLTRGTQELEQVVQYICSGTKVLSLGLVNGRNVWRNPLKESQRSIEKVAETLGKERVWIGSSCSLQHVPMTLRHEEQLDHVVRSRLAFAEEKLAEIQYLAGDSRYEKLGLRYEQEFEAIHKDSRLWNQEVRNLQKGLTEKDFSRSQSYAHRKILQQEKLQLPLFPTTTIGSFPQTQEVRRQRAAWRQGKLSLSDYESFLQEEISHCVAVQETLGLDMLVHGEFERNDMVEYFGELLEGFAFTRQGWVQSYGSRYVKPPILFGDVSRKEPMTVRWSSYAQGLTSKPLKGMLTGPITILQWSFVRDDLPRQETATQVALALRAEVLDLEEAGLAAIQIDEPALREGLPLKKEDQSHYLEWAVRAFRLAVCGVRDETQIHTHMCYSEFNDTMPAIIAMDADVITIEAARSGLELLEAFLRHQYPNGIGPGFYDIHSPAIPALEQILDRMRETTRVLPVDHLWVNPDCGLKTRNWPETEASLRVMVQAAEIMRDMLKSVPNAHKEKTDAMAD